MTNDREFFLLCRWDLKWDPSPTEISSHPCRDVLVKPFLKWCIPKVRKHPCRWNKVHWLYPECYLENFHTPKLFDLTTWGVRSFSSLSPGIKTFVTQYLNLSAASRRLKNISWYRPGPDMYTAFPTWYDTGLTWEPHVSPIDFRSDLYVCFTCFSKASLTLLNPKISQTSFPQKFKADLIKRHWQRPNLF